MATLRVYNATILTMCDGAEPIHGAELVNVDGVIEYVGPERDHPDEGFDEQIDAGGAVLLPGLVNAHTHLAMTLLRGFADDMPLQEWLTQKIWPTEAGLVEEDVYWGTLLGILEMLRAGVTCYNDMYHYPGAGVRAAIDGGIRALPSGVLLQFVDERRDVSSATEFALQTRETSPERIVPMLGPHAPYSCTPEMLTEVAEAALEHGFSIHIHLSETVNEVEQVEQQTGMKPVAYLEKLGVLNAHVTAAHCVHLDDGEIAVLAERGVGIAHCPTSNMKLASGFARVPDMLERGAIVGLGTDGASSNNRLDLLGEARMAALIHKGYAGDPRVVNARQALEMATIGAARAIGLQETIGSLEVGKRADFTLVSMAEAHNQPLHNLCSQLIYAAEAGDVVLTAVDGVVLYERGAYPHLDAERIIARANESAMRLTRS